MREEYEEIPYLAGTHAESHPSRIAAVATLHGLEPAPLEKARVLEVGCARGRNLVPIAADHPGGRFVGVDVAPGQIADGEALVARLGLKNVELVAADLREAPIEGPFDYVVAHGFLSWVPADVRAAFFALCGRVLSEEGVVFASYNALPGWHLRRVTRDLLLRGGEGHEGVERVKRARELLGMVGGIARAKNDLWAKLLEHEHDLIADKGDWYVAHDHMEAVNEPFYLGQVVQMAAPHGLQFLGEADRSREVPPLPPQVQQRLQEVAGDPIRFEEILDFVGAREFRCTLLCRDTRTTHAFPVPAHLERLYLSMEAEVQDDGELRSRRPMTFRSRRRSFQIDEPILKASLQALVTAFPEAVSFRDVTRRALSLLGRSEISPEELGALAESLLYAATNGFVDLDARRRRFVPDVSDRPVANRVARAQLALGDDGVATGWHRTLRLPAFDRHLLRHLDGRPRDEVLDALLADARAGRLDTDLPPARDGLAGLVDRRLTALAEKGLLVS